MGTATTQEIGCVIGQCVFPFIEYYKPFTQFCVKTQDLLFLYYRFYISMDLSDEKYTKYKSEECINVIFNRKIHFYLVVKHVSKIPSSEWWLTTE